MEKSQNDKLIGMIFAGRFEIVRLIGQGGMARVYLATDRVNSVPVAVKVLKNEFLSDRELVQRFDVEAKAASSLDHPNIVKVYGVGEEQGNRFMIMQYVEGSTLKEMIEHYTRLDWQVAVPLAIQVARALEEAHANGIVHRDIKPHNILVTKDHRALVTDFGIARATTPNTITIAGGSTMGSVHYFSPEQARGSIVGAKADIYSLGILLYEVLTGRLPFEADTDVAVALMQLQDHPVPPCEHNPAIPAGLSNIVLKCMRKQPGERYDSAKALADELQAFLQNPNGSYGEVKENPDGRTSIYKTPLVVSHAGPGASKLAAVEAQLVRSRKRRRRDSRITLLILLLILGLLTGGIYLAVRTLSNSLQPVSTEDQGIPLGNYVNRSYDEASAELNRLNIPFQTKQVFSDKVKEGFVVEQNLPEGRRIKKISLTPLVLVVSKGSDEFVLEDYAGKSGTEIENLLRSELHLNVSMEMVSDEKVPADRILRTDPPAGSKLRPGYAIKVYVSTGPKRSQVPNLKGLSLDEAEMYLQQNDLVLGDYSGGASYAEKDRVIESQSPEPGTAVKPGSKVSVVLTGREGASKTGETKPGSSAPSTSKHSGSSGGSGGFNPFRP